MGEGRVSGLRRPPRHWGSEGGRHVSGRRRAGSVSDFGRFGELRIGETREARQGKARQEWGGYKATGGFTGWMNDGRRECVRRGSTWCFCRGREDGKGGIRPAWG